MKNLIRILALAALVFCAFPRSARAAAELTGRISGYVYDPTGAALSEVPLTLTSASVMPVAISRVTGDDGKFEFPNLVPGEDYVLEVNVPGFTPIKQTNIKVRLGQASPVDVNLTVLTETQAVATYQIIEKVNPVLNPDSAQSGGVITYEKAATTPIFHQVEGMAKQLAGVSPSNTPSTRGGLSRYGKFYVDGMDTTDITDGSITAPMTFDSVDNFEILTGAMDAQYNSMGMVTNAVTKTGGNEWKYDVSMTLEPSMMAAKNVFPNTQQPMFGTYFSNNQVGPDTAFYSPTVNVGGPLIKDKLWFFAAYQQNFSTKQSPLTVDNFFQNRDTHTTTSLGRMKLTYQPTSTDRVSVAFNLDRNVINNTSGSVTTAQDAEGKLHRGGEFFIVNYDHNFSDTVLFQLQSGITYKNVATEPVFNDFNTPSHFDNFSSTTRFNYGGNWSYEDKYRIQFDPTLSWKLKAAGTHQMKAGFQYSFMYDNFTQGVAGWQRYGDGQFNSQGFIPDPTVSPGTLLSHGYGCDPTVPGTFALCNTVTNYYNQNGDQAPLTTHAWTRTYGFFVQDRWTVNKQLTVIPGFRVDIGRLQGMEGLVTTPLVGFGPRLSATYDVFADRKTLLVAHAGRSNDVGNIFVAQHGNPNLTAVQSKWVGAAPPAGIAANTFYPCAINDPNTGFCSTSGGASGRTFAPGQKPPFVDEISGGIHHEVAPETVLGVDVTYRHYGNMWEDQEVNRVYDASGTHILGTIDGVNHSVLQAVARPDAYRQYTGMDLWVQGTPGRWDVLASYTLAYNTGTVGDYFDGYLLNPRQDIFYNGSSPDERRHHLKGSITYKTSFGLDLGTRINFNTGTPLWESFGRNPADNSQTIFKSPRGTGFPLQGSTANLNDPSSWSSLNNPANFNIDLQARYNLGNALSLQHNKAEIILLVVNVLNDSNAGGYLATSGSRLGLATFHDNPLQAELMLRFRN